MLSARVSEFPRLPKNEQVDVIHHALDASPTIPFDKFSTLLRTWLEVVSEQGAEDRRVLLEAYAGEILSTPDKLVQLHMDGIVEVFLGLEPNRQSTIITTLRMILSGMGDDDKSKLVALMPESIKQILDI